MLIFFTILLALKTSLFVDCRRYTDSKRSGKKVDRLKGIYAFRGELIPHLNEALVVVVVVAVVNQDIIQPNTQRGNQAVHYIVNWSCIIRCLLWPLSLVQSEA